MTGSYEMTTAKRQTISSAFIVQVFWVVLTNFQYGYHIPVLNQIQAVLTCQQKPSNPSVGGIVDISDCIPMSTNAFGVVTAVFTLGGFVSSLFADRVINKYGRKVASMCSCACVCIGSGMISSASGILGLVAGRFLTGIGSGIGLCVVPIYLGEISPAHVKGSIGVLNQLAIVFGILTAQGFGLRYSRAVSPAWRPVFTVSALSSAFQLVWGLTGWGVYETPPWLDANRSVATGDAVRIALWGPEWKSVASHVHDSEDTEALLENDSSSLSASRASGPESPAPTMSVSDLLRSEDLRSSVLLISVAMFSQQATGMNAVMYFSNDILSKAFPSSASFVSLGIAVLNVAMTFAPVFLIERLGRRTMLLASIFGGFASAIVLGYGLNGNYGLLSTIGILAFVAFFAIGQGPIPFVIIPEIAPFYAVSALSSYALALNWMVNFLCGLAFLPLRDLLAGNEGKSGRIFYVFSLLLLGCGLILSRILRI
jgi:sugar porter (SP) family MFS transporter